jgi:hypothetical protein
LTQKTNYQKFNNSNSLLIKTNTAQSLNPLNPHGHLGKSAPKQLLLRGEMIRRGASVDNVAE